MHITLSIPCQALTAGSAHAVFAANFVRVRLQGALAESLDTWSLDTCMGEAKTEAADLLAAVEEACSSQAAD